MSNQIGTLKMGQKFKKTPVGEIPVDWECLKLSDVAFINMGQSPESSSCNDKGAGLPFYQGNADFGRLYPVPSSWCDSPTKIAKTGDILISVRAPVGEVNIAPHECCIGRGLSAIRPEKSDAKYLYYSLLASLRLLDKLAQGSTFKAINGGDLSELPIAIPSSSQEQEKIGEVLWRVDELTGYISDEIKKTKMLKKGLMCQLLTRGIGHKKFKKTEVGEIPAEWECVTIDSVKANIKNAIVDGPFGSNLKTMHYRTSGIPVIQSGFVTSNHFEAQEYVYVDEELFQEQQRSRVSPGDIVMAKIGAQAGTCAILPLSHPVGILAGNSLKIAPDPDKCLAEYLLYYLHYRYSLDGLSQVKTTTAQPAISLKVLKGFAIPLPTIKEQQQIVDMIRSIDMHLCGLDVYLECSVKLKTGLMSVLLTGRVRIN